MVPQPGSVHFAAEDRARINAASSRAVKARREEVTVVGRRGV
jgi:hypothetical protein